MKKWYLFLFTDESKTELFKILKCNSIKDVAYILDLKPQIVSNFYHKLINSRGNLKYCILLSA
jgi:hypothetical protein